MTNAKAIQMGMSRLESVAKARNHFDGLGIYERDQIAVLGTAFTIYENEGDAFCRELNRVAQEWRKATVSQ